MLVAYVRASLLAYSSTGGIADPSNEQIVSLVAYRLLLHPLAKYPGPLAGRLTDWYSVYHTARGDNHVNLYELHLAYGREQVEDSTRSWVETRQEVADASFDIVQDPSSATGRTVCRSTVPPPCETSMEPTGRKPDSSRPTTTPSSAITLGP